MSIDAKSTRLVDDRSCTFAGDVALPCPVSDCCRCRSHRHRPVQSCKMGIRCLQLGAGKRNSFSYAVKLAERSLPLAKIAKKAVKIWDHTLVLLNHLSPH
jgi:hypothetical protein